MKIDASSCRVGFRISPAQYFETARVSDELGRPRNSDCETTKRSLAGKQKRPKKRKKKIKKKTRKRKPLRAVDKWSVYPMAGSSHRWPGADYYLVVAHASFGVASLIKKKKHTPKTSKKSDKTFHSMSGDRTRSLICFRLFLFCVVFHKFCFVIGWRNPPRR